jgi:hypothetical protein
VANWCGESENGTAAHRGASFFLVAHAWIAFAYKPGMSDTRRYSIYAFVISNAQLAGQSPYDYYEGLKRQFTKGDDQLALRSDQLTIEYPPLALEIMRAPLPFVAKDASVMRGMGKNDIADWQRGYRLLYFLAHGAVLAGLAWWLGRRKMGSSWGIAVGTVAGIVMAYVLYDRLDLWLGLVLLGSLSALITGHRYIAMTLLGVAVSLKLVPIFLLPLFLLGVLPGATFSDGLLSRRTLRIGLLAGQVFAATGLAVFLPFRLMWGPRVWDFLAYHSQRGFQIESTWSSVLLVAAQLGYPAQVTHIFGAEEVVGPGVTILAKVSVLVVLAVVGMAYWLIWGALRNRRVEDSASGGTLAQQNPQIFVWGAFAVLALAMAGSKVFSPQYLCWFLPSLLLVERPRDRSAAVPLVIFLLVCGLTTAVFPGFWDEAVRVSGIAQGKIIILLPTLRVTLIILARNLVWIAFCIFAIIQLRAARPMVEAATVPDTSPIRRRRHHR